LSIEATIYHKEDPRKREIPYDVRRRRAKRLSCVCTLRRTRVSSFLLSLFPNKHEQEAYEQQTAGEPDSSHVKYTDEVTAHSGTDSE